LEASRALSAKLRRAALVLAWEGFWRLYWPVPAWLALFCGVALIDVLPILPPFWHGAILVLFACGFLVFLARLRHFRWPDKADCQRRLEHDSGFKHQPLAQLQDRPATGDETLWQIQRQRWLGLLAKLRLAPPAPGLPARDPLGLRFAPLLLLAIGLAAGRHDMAARFDRALDPGGRAANAGLALQIWITPPSYTGVSPFMLPEHQDEEVRIPAGSKLLAELQGSESDARLFVDRTKLSFTRLDRLAQKLETELDEGSSLSLRLGRHLLARWRVAVIQDQPPVVAFSSDPEALAEGRLKLAISASDDYAVTGLALLLQRQDGEDEVALPAVAGQKQASAEMVVDLAAHPWSGLPVTMRPVATDGAGHHAVGAAFAMTLPEREFHHPVARLLAQLRHDLANDAGQRLQVIERLGQLLSRPDLFNNDTVAYLQMTAARARLMRDRSIAAIPSVLDMLWAAALRIEDGDVQDARDAVDQAAQALAEALEKGATDAELSRLTEALNQAMNRLIASLAKRGAAPAPTTTSPNGKVMTSDQLQAMLRQLSDLAHAGARDAARQSLQNLRNLLDQLSAGGNQSMQQWQEELQQLDELTEGQKQLLDRTFRRAQQQQPGGGGERQTQEVLRQKLQKMLQGLSMPALEQAERAMRQAEQALQGERAEDAIGAEGQALAKLREGVRQMMDAMAQAGGPQDPLGREMPGGRNFDDGKVKIPSQSDLGKSREILDELRRRAGEQDRTPEERAYLKRLLDKIY
jgi:uncharacterized protein (TIGR02302 family)